MRTVAKLLVCAGAQKAGTTWLHSVLESTGVFHTGYFKEIHYFDWIHDGTWYMNRRRAEQLKWHVDRLDSEALGNWLGGVPAIDATQKAIFDILSWCSQPATDQWYVDMMTPDDSKKWAIDFSPGYATIGDAGFAHMARLASELRLLFVMRDPVERAWSGLIHETRFSKNGDADPSVLLQESTDNLLERICGGNISRYTDYQSTLSALKANGLLRYSKIWIYEDLSLNPKRYLKDLFDFLEIEESYLPADSVIQAKTFESPKLPIPEELKTRLVELYTPQVKLLETEYGVSTKAWADFN